MFFTQDYAVKASCQRQQQAKKELRLLIPAEKHSISVLSSNFHGVTFGRAFNLTVDGRVATSACVGWGYERWVYAIFSQFGFDVNQWPVRLREEFENHQAGKRGLMVTIQALTPEHFGLVARWLSKREINRWLTPEWRNRAVNTALIAVAVRNRRNRLFLVRCVSEPCGLVALANIEEADKTGMVWYVLGEQKLSARGIISEAVTQLTRLCFCQMGLASIYAWIMEDNIASLRVLQKAGLREAGRIRCAASSAGRQVDRIYFDLIASEVR